MPILKWLFHKDIDLQALKREIKVLYDLFKDYIIFFEEKKRAVGFLYNYNLLGLKEEIQRFNRSILKELEDEEKEQKLVNLILSSNVLTEKEARLIKVIKLKLRLLRVILRSQTDLFEKLSEKINEFEEELEKDAYFVNSEAAKLLRNEIENCIKTLRELVNSESMLLFGEAEDAIDEIKKYITDDFEFPPLENIECPAANAALLAERNLNIFDNPRIDITYVGRIPPSISCQSYKLIFYPGSLDDPISIFCFPNAEMYILQDPQQAINSLSRYFKILNRTNIISNLKIKGISLTFTFNGQRKLLKAYYGEKGYSEKYVPPEVRQFGADVVMTKAFTLNEEEKTLIFEKISPFIKKGSFVHKDLCIDLENRGFKKIHRDWYQKL